MLVDPALSGMPAFLTPKPGLNSGFMIPQVTAAALVSENKQRAYPASVDSIPTSANQEDHVSMAAHGARRLAGMVENAVCVVGIELLAAAQGCDFHCPLASYGAVLEKVRARLRARCRISTTTGISPPTWKRRELRWCGGAARVAGAGGRHAAGRSAGRWGGEETGMTADDAACPLLPSSSPSRHRAAGRQPAAHRHRHPRRDRRRPRLALAGAQGLRLVDRAALRLRRRSRRQPRCAPRSRAPPST